MAKAYARVLVTPLNGGSGKIQKAFATRAAFASWYRTYRQGAEYVPEHGSGAMGDGVINFQWWIIEEA